MLFEVLVTFVKQIVDYRYLWNIICFVNQEAFNLFVSKWFFAVPSPISPSIMRKVPIVTTFAYLENLTRYFPLVIRFGFFIVLSTTETEKDYKSLFAY